MVESAKQPGAAEDAASPSGDVEGVTGEGQPERSGTEDSLSPESASVSTSRLAAWTPPSTAPAVLAPPQPSFLARQCAKAAAALKPRSWQDLCLQYEYVEVSCLLFRRDHLPRRWLIRLVTYRLFDWALLAMILCNCVALALDSNEPGFSTTSLAHSLQTANLFFLCVFSAEMVLKIIAFGLVAGPHTYLRDGWNWLDFIIVASGWLEMLNVGNYIAIRCIRLLRTFRAVSKIEKLRALVTTVIRSVPRLMDVMWLAFFFYALFGAIVLELYGQGALRGRCAFPTFDNTSVVLDPNGRQLITGVQYTIQGADVDRLCQGPATASIAWFNDSGSPLPEGLRTSGTGRMCNYGADDDPAYPYGMFCAPFRNPGEPGGYRHFDNFFFAALTLFLYISTQDWSQVMYDTQDAVSVYSWVLSFAILLIGGIFLANLFLAVLYLEFGKHSRDFMASGDAAAQDADGAGAALSHSDSAGSLQSHSGSGLSSAFQGTSKTHVSGLLLESGSGGGGSSAARGRRRRSSIVDFGLAIGRSGRRMFADSRMLSLTKRVQLACFKIQLSKTFNKLVLAAIVLNSIILALIWYDSPPAVDAATNYANYAFTVFFLGEMVVKVLGLGVTGYCASWGNWFDGLVTLASVAEMVVDLSPLNSNSAARSLSTARSLRLLRLFRLASQWKGLQRIIVAFMSSLSSIGWLTLLLLFFLFVGSLLGMQLFGYHVAFCSTVDGSSQQCLSTDVRDCPKHFDCYIPCSSADAGLWITVPGSPYGGQAYCEAVGSTGGSGDQHELQYYAQVGKATVPPQNFDTFWQAFLTLFQVLTMDNWDTAMDTVMAATSPYAALYFVIVMLLGRFIVLNLFLAILLDGFSDLDPEADESGNSGEVPQVLAGGRVVPVTGAEETGRVDPPLLFESQVHPVSGSGEAARVEVEGNLKCKESPGEAASCAGQPGFPPCAQPSTPDHHSEQPSLNGSPTKAQRAHARGNVRFSQVQDDDTAFLQAHECAGSQLLSSSQPGSRDGSRLQLGPLKSATGGGLGDREANRSYATITSSAAQIKMRQAMHQRAFGDLYGRSLGLLGPHSALRVLCNRAASSLAFDAVVLLAILGSCIALALETPSLDADSQQGRVLYVLNLIFTAIFLFEAMIKIIVSGLLLNGPPSYLRSAWNQLDCGVLLLSLLVLVLQAAGVSTQLLWLRALRAVRALRALRVASRIPGIQVIVEALFTTIPAIGSVALVAILFFYIFTVLTVHMLVGQMSSCQDPSGNTLDPAYLMSDGDSLNKQWCERYSQDTYLVTNTSYHDALGVTVQPFPVTAVVWVTPLRNFDNFAAAFWVLFVMTLQENWSEVMFLAADTTGIDSQPEQGAWIYGSAFFVVFMVVCSFFILNLVISVSIDKFNQMKKKQSGNAFLLTQSQHQWLTIQKLMAAVAMKETQAPPSSAHPLRLLLFKLVTHPAFDVVMSTIIILNACVLLTVHYGMSPAWSAAISASNVAFTAIYILELAARLTALGLPVFLRSAWNLFDFFIVAVSVASVLVDYLAPSPPSAMQLIRVIRIFRIFKLVPKIQGLRLMFQTFVWSLPALLNVSSVMFILMFIYAVVCMNLFGNMVYGAALNEHANFTNFLRSLQTLFRMLTGENWDYIMRDCMQLDNCLLVTADWTDPGNASVSVPAGTYLDSTDPLVQEIPSGQLSNQCSPAPILAVLVFCSYMVLICLLMLQLIVAVILENISTLSMTEQLVITQAHITQFVDAWQQLDLTGSSFILAPKLRTLLLEVDAPVGLRRTRATGLDVQAIIMSCSIPIRNNHVHFTETLHALCGRVAGVELPPEEEYEIHRRLILKLPKDASAPKYTAAHYYAAMAVQCAIRGFMLRRSFSSMCSAYHSQESRGGEGNNRKWCLVREAIKSRMMEQLRCRRVDEVPYKQEDLDEELVARAPSSRAVIKMTQFLSTFHKPAKVAAATHAAPAAADDVAKGKGKGSGGVAERPAAPAGPPAAARPPKAFAKAAAFFAAGLHKPAAAPAPSPLQGGQGDHACDSMAPRVSLLHQSCKTEPNTPTAAAGCGQEQCTKSSPESLAATSPGSTLTPETSVAEFSGQSGAAEGCAAVPRLWSASRPHARLASSPPEGPGSPRALAPTRASPSLAPSASSGREGAAQPSRPNSFHQRVPSAGVQQPVPGSPHRQASVSAAEPPALLELASTVPGSPHRQASSSLADPPAPLECASSHSWGARRQPPTLSEEGLGQRPHSSTLHTPVQSTDDTSDGKTLDELLLMVSRLSIVAPRATSSSNKPAP